MTTEARERLIDKIAAATTETAFECGGPCTRPEARAALAAILTDYDALAAVVDWPELLAAGERVGKVEQFNALCWPTNPTGPMCPPSERNPE